MEQVLGSCRRWSITDLNGTPAAEAEARREPSGQIVKLSLHSAGRCTGGGLREGLRQRKGGSRGRGRGGGGGDCRGRGWENPCKKCRVNTHSIRCAVLYPIASYHTKNSRAWTMGPEQPPDETAYATAWAKAVA